MRIRKNLRYNGTLESYSILFSRQYCVFHFFLLHSSITVGFYSFIIVYYIVFVVGCWCYFIIFRNSLEMLYTLVFETFDTFLIHPIPYNTHFCIFYFSVSPHFFVFSSNKFILPIFRFTCCWPVASPISLTQIEQLHIE